MCRVQNQTNVITWQFNQGDPSPIEIVVINSNNATLNGAFSIAQFVNVSQQVSTFRRGSLWPDNNCPIFALRPSLCKFITLHLYFSLLSPRNPKQRHRSSMFCLRADGTGAVAKMR